MTKSKIFLYILLSFLTGVFLASVLVLPYENGEILKFLIGGIAVFGIISLALFWRKSNKFLIGFFILFFAFGIFWYQSDIQNSQKGVSDFFDKKIKGVIVEDPEFKNDKADYILKTDSGLKILIQTMRYPEYEYGDEISVEGKIEEPKNFDDKFDYKSYLARDNIYFLSKNPRITLLSKNNGSQILKQLYGFKNKLEGIFRQILPEPHASLLAGVTLGSKSDLPRNILDDFSRTGTSHIVALSGYNISAISLFIMFVLGYFMISRSISFWVSLLTIVMFVLMTGASASAVRAAVMGILILIASQQGRLYTAKNALVFAGAVMVFLNPKILRFDVGFQLSFMAVLGLILLSPWIEGKIKNMPEIFGIKKR